jgi:hypothetical protein
MSFVHKQILSSMGYVELSTSENNLMSLNCLEKIVSAKLLVIH